MDTPKDLVRRVVALVEDSKEKRWYVPNVSADPAYRAEFKRLCELSGYAAEEDGTYIKVYKYEQRS